MSTIPPDVYELVGDLAAGMTNATLADDHALAASLYQRLVHYHEEQLAAGRSHPFIIETLADYTDDPAQAIRYYEQALAMSRQMTSDEPTHTILIALGEQLIAMGRRAQGEAFIRDGHAEALRRDESDLI
ncbi:MAG: hypothetical protein WDM80_03130 [Limisphaerales bacterium]